MLDNIIRASYTAIMMIEATHKGDTIMELTPSKQYELRVKDGLSQILTQKEVLKAYPKHWTFRAYGKVGEKVQVAQGDLVRVR